MFKHFLFCFWTLLIIILGLGFLMSPVILYLITDNQDWLWCLIGTIFIVSSLASYYMPNTLNQRPKK